MTDLLTLLRQHKPADANEADMTARTIAFVEANPNHLERSLLIGHITGSAWITSPDESQVVLIHHRKLDRWFQPGGHADGNPDIVEVSRQEAGEETELPDLTLASPSIFDVDIHTIPARGEVPEHLHYDIRFQWNSNKEIKFGENREVKEIRWVTMAEAERLCDSESISRMVRKAKIGG
ncbi:NUDIX hydrolase [Fibrella aquatica]|uniref:NUDIX hydrolase n=1 Tax=Fibrella aquatica TaxID=3242487 RepID=UPI0035213A59